ncbi:hypothetical protein MHYP_G00315120 [Metynnis hypsauchen]
MKIVVYRSVLLVCVLVRVVASAEEEISLAGLIRRITAGVLVRGQLLGDHQNDPSDKGPRVLTKDGVIRGLTADKAHVFYGIPFADPPVASNRWRPPQQVTPWTGEYDATFPRAACMQRCIGPITEECPKTVSEDCLYLNVFVPLSVNFSNTVLKLPVMVWIHGGDFIAGTATKPLYDSRFISNFTHTVVVTVAYRLGAFGFLVSGKDPKSAAVGNYGILDQQAALLWVQQNIAMHESLKLGKNFAKITNCSLQDYQCLQSLSSQTVLAAQIKSSSKLVNPFRFLEVFESWGPYIDGLLIQEQAVSAFQKGHWQKDKPVLLGTTSEEGVIFVYGVFSKPVSAVECTIYTTAIFKQHTLKILRKYLPLYRNTDHRDMLAQIVTDYIFLCPSRRAARAAALSSGSVWTYVFDHAASDHHVWSGLTFCYDHVCHGAELPFLFGSATVANFTMTKAEQLLSNRMLCYWGSFAHASSHTPLTEFCRQQRPPTWPRYSASSGWLMMNLTIHSHAQPGSRSDICDFWDRLGIY